ncbi:MAG: hypothetical protein GF421_10460 [Candidatus Aminicenantes bacterium]|nr:hypothetical protein [Candidatus Aminicenantes bacterium]
MMRFFRWLIKKWKYVVTFLVGIFVTLFFIGFTHLSFNLTGTNTFCGRCHEMQVRVKTWEMSSHSVNPYGVVADCVDCHLPASGLSRYSYKAYSGLRDVVVHYLGDPSKISWEEKTHTKQNYLFEDACITCHQDLTPPSINRGGFLAHREWQNSTIQKKCWDCHEKMVHYNTPILFTDKHIKKSYE